MSEHTILFKLLMVLSRLLRASNMMIMLSTIRAHSYRLIQLNARNTAFLIKSSVHYKRTVLKERELSEKLCFQVPLTNGRNRNSYRFVTMSFRISQLCRKTTQLKRFVTNENDVTFLILTKKTRNNPHVQVYVQKSFPNLCFILACTLLSPQLSLWSPGCAQTNMIQALGSLNRGDRPTGS